MAVTPSPRALSTLRYARVHPLRNVLSSQEFLHSASSFSQPPCAPWRFHAFLRREIFTYQRWQKSHDCGIMDRRSYDSQDKWPGTGDVISRMSRRKWHAKSFFSSKFEARETRRERDRYFVDWNFPNFLLRVSVYFGVSFFFLSLFRTLQQSYKKLRGRNVEAGILRNLLGEFRKPLFDAHSRSAKNSSNPRYFEISVQSFVTLRIRLIF